MSETIPLPERFWAKVNKTDGCWLWTGAKCGGYGVFEVGTKARRYAHRLAYEEANGAIPNGLLACHRCDVRNCVNPDHLFLGTTADNVADKIRKGRGCSGESHGRAKVTVGQIEEIRDLHRQGMPHRKIASRFPISPTQVRNIIHGRNWGAQ